MKVLNEKRGFLSIPAKCVITKPEESLLVTSKHCWASVLSHRRLAKSLFPSLREMVPTKLSLVEVASWASHPLWPLTLWQEEMVSRCCFELWKEIPALWQRATVVLGFLFIKR